MFCGWRRIANDLAYKLGKGDKQRMRGFVFGVGFGTPAASNVTDRASSSDRNQCLDTAQPTWLAWSVVTT
jgi:hypothetical protein